MAGAMLAITGAGRVAPAEAGGFDASSLVERKGLRALDRASRLALGAAARALADSGFERTEANARRCGLFLGTAFGGLDSIAGFDELARTRGFMALTPAAFVNAVMNAPAGQLALMLGFKGPNMTASSGDASSADALLCCLGMDWRANGLSLAVVAGMEELSPIYRAYQAAREGDGSNLLEGAAALALEPEGEARARGARVHALLAGAARIYAPAPAEAALARLMERALADAGLAPQDVATVVASGAEPEAASAPRATAPPGCPVDAAQLAPAPWAAAERAARGRLLPHARVISPQPAPSALYSAGGLFQALAALQALADGACDAPVLINAFGKDGNQACLALI